MAKKKVVKKKVSTAVAVVPKAEVEKIEKANQPVITNANALTIKSADDETQAYDVLKQIKDRINLVEGQRTAITKPLNASIKQVNALFKTLSSPLKEADNIIRKKILTFRQQREEAAAKREAKLLAKIEEAEEDGDDDVVEQLEQRAAQVKARVGESSTMKRWTFEVVDAWKVPSDYLIVDEQAIRKAVREGVREIKGVRIYQEESIRVTR